MTESTTPPTVRDDVHASDGDMLRIIDQETTSEDADMQTHVAGCASCAARLDVYRRRSEQVSFLLATYAPAPASEASSRTDLAIARARRDRAKKSRRPHAFNNRRAFQTLGVGGRVAVAVALIAGAAAASPARTWVLERLGVVRESPPVAAPVERDSMPVAPEQNAAGPLVRFAVARAEFFVRVQAHQLEGTLEILVGGEPEATAQIFGSMDTESLVVLPDGVRIQNTAVSTARYRVVVPTQVRQVRVRFEGDGREVVVNPTSGQTRVVQLSEAR